MCEKLGLEFHSTIRQPTNIVGELLCGYEPSMTENIVGDGNCIFRCLSKIITGSQESHSQLRDIIVSFIASEGTTKLAGIFDKSVQLQSSTF